MNKEFILQCEKAIELQLIKTEWFFTDEIHWRTLDKDKKTVKAEGTTVFGMEDEHFPPRKSGIIHPNRFRFGKKDELCSYSVYIWLPTQEQLQEMLKHKYDEPYGLIYEFNDFLQKRRPWRSWDTMRQLWLEFVMKENYGKIWRRKNKKEIYDKVWNSKDWITIKEE